MTRSTTQPAEWHEQRMTGIGATDSPIVVGVRPGLFELWEEKTGQRPPREETREMRRGKLLEPVIAQMYEDETGRRLRRSPALYRHPDRPFLVAHIDRRTRGRLVEIKSSAFGRGWGEPADSPDSIPPRVRVQVQHQMEVTGVDAADVVVLIAGHDLRRYELAYDPLMADGIVESATDFWGYVERREPPPIDGSEDASHYLSRRYPRASGQDVVATPEQALLVEQLRAVREELKAAGPRERELKNRIKEALGEHSKLIGPGFSVSWTGGEEKPTVDWEAVAAALGELDRMAYGLAVGRFTEMKATPRVLRPTWKREAA